jgi:hypothetical protein
MEKMSCYQLGICPKCKSKHTGVWEDRKGWFYVGCLDCSNKTYVDAAWVNYTVEWWKEGRCGE